MKKNALLLFGLLAASFTTYAQVERTVEKTAPVVDTATATLDMPVANSKADRREALKELNLSKEQKQQMKTLREEQQAAKQQIENDNTLSENQKKAKLREMRKTGLSKTKAILTPEQFEKFKQLRREGKAD